MCAGRARVFADASRYLSIQYLLGEALVKKIEPERAQVLRQAQAAFARFLGLLDDYRLLSRPDVELLERFSEDRNHFELVVTKDAALRRDAKISRFRDVKELKLKLEYLAQDPDRIENDDAAARQLYQAEIQLNIFQAFQALEHIALELGILKMRPLEESRERRTPSDGYSDRLDLNPQTRGRGGPILSREGKPLQPFTLLSDRQRLRDKVYGPDHALPTMTIDEYLDEERRRGGIIDGANDAPALVNDEDDMQMADAATDKAREWDEFIEANPKGSGNTLNRG